MRGLLLQVTSDNADRPLQVYGEVWCLFWLQVVGCAELQGSVSLKKIKPSCEYL